MQPKQPPPSDQGIPFAGVRLIAAEPGWRSEKRPGARVFGVVAGPAALAGLRANDLIVRIDDVEVDAASANAIINAASPGQRLALDVVRNNEPIELTIIIDSVERWAPPSSFLSAVAFEASGTSPSAVSADHVTPYALTAFPEVGPIAGRIDRMFARAGAKRHRLSQAAVNSPSDDEPGKHE